MELLTIRELVVKCNHGDACVAMVITSLLGSPQELCVRVHVVGWGMVMFYSWVHLVCKVGGDVNVS